MNGGYVSTLASSVSSKVARTSFHPVHLLPIPTPPPQPMDNNKEKDDVKDSNDTVDDSEEGNVDHIHSHIPRNPGSIPATMRYKRKPSTTTTEDDSSGNLHPHKHHHSSLMSTFNLQPSSTTVSTSSSPVLPLTTPSNDVHHLSSSSSSRMDISLISSISVSSSPVNHTISSSSSSSSSVPTTTSSSINQTPIQGDNASFYPYPPKNDSSNNTGNDINYNDTLHKIYNNVSTTNQNISEKYNDEDSNVEV